MLAGQVSNLQPPDPKSGVLPVELPATGGHWDSARYTSERSPGACRDATSVLAGTLRAVMGSLIKKRRKRMRKKKHRKMLKRTRAQRMRGK